MELNKLRHERIKIVTDGKLQSENIDCFYSPVRISFSDNERSYIDKKWNYEVKKKPSILMANLFMQRGKSFCYPDWYLIRA